MNPRGREAALDAPLGQRRQEALSILIKRWHLHIGPANLPGGMSIAPCQGEQAALPGQSFGAAVIGGEDDAGVEDFQSIHLVNYFQESLFPQGFAAQAV